MLPGGFGSAVLEHLEDAFAERGGERARVLRIGLPDDYVTHGKPALLREEVGLTGASVAERILAAISSGDTGSGSALEPNTLNRVGFRSLFSDGRSVRLVERGWGYYREKRYVPLVVGGSGRQADRCPETDRPHAATAGIAEDLRQEVSSARIE